MFKKFTFFVSVALMSLVAGLTVFAQPVGPMGSGGLPSGTAGQTLMHNGRNWTANNNIFNTGNNVGIGTTNPSLKLHVKGATLLENSADGILQLVRQGGFVGSFPTYFQLRTDNTFIIRNSGSDTLSMRNGLVGIGTTTPSAKLDVAGQIKITGGAPGVGKVLTSDATGLATWQTPSRNSGSGNLPSGTSGQTLRYDGTNWVANSIIFNNPVRNFVGIGTTNPGAKLDISSSEYTILRLTRQNANSGVFPTYFSMRTDGALIINNTGVDTIALKSGKMGLGTSNPGSRIHVVGGDIAITSSNNGLILKAFDGQNCFRIRVNNNGAVSTSHTDCP